MGNARIIHTVTSRTLYSALRPRPCNDIYRGGLNSRSVDLVADVGKVYSQQEVNIYGCSAGGDQSGKYEFGLK